MRDVAFWFRKKSGFPKLQDSGLADVLLGGEGMTVTVHLTSAEKDKTSVYKVKNVNVKLDTLKFSIRDSKHDLLYKTLRPLAAGVIKRQITKAIQDSLTTAFEYIDGQLVGVRDRYNEAKTSDETSRNEMLKSVRAVSLPAPSHPRRLPSPSPPQSPARASRTKLSSRPLPRRRPRAIASVPPLACLLARPSRPLTPRAALPAQEGRGRVDEGERRGQGEALQRRLQARLAPPPRPRLARRLDQPRERARRRRHVRHRLALGRVHDRLSARAAAAAVAALVGMDSDSALVVASRRLDDTWNECFT
jgi:hypothetical protein